MNQSPSYNRRAFLRLGAGIAAGTTMAVSAERNKVLVGESPWATGLDANLPDAGGSPAAQARKTLRPFGVFLANHNQDTGLHFWNLERWKGEIRDTRRMGAKAMWYLPFQFGQRSRLPADQSARI